VSKRSFLTYSSSFEADDERSSTASPGDFGMMSRSRSRSNSGSSFGLPPARYPGDDTRPTNRKELAGWYAYAFAAEVYVICGRKKPF
jgi:UMF1 family MFS transporter